jgi:hypothetical protein
MFPKEKPLIQLKQQADRNKLPNALLIKVPNLQSKIKLGHKLLKKWEPRQTTVENIDRDNEDEKGLKKDDKNNPK